MRYMKSHSKKQYKLILASLILIASVIAAYAYLDKPDNHCKQLIEQFERETPQGSHIDVLREPPADVLMCYAEEQ